MGRVRDWSGASADERDSGNRTDDTRPDDFSLICCGIGEKGAHSVWAPMRRVTFP